MFEHLGTSFNVNENDRWMIERNSIILNKFIILHGFTKLEKCFILIMPN